MGVVAVEVAVVASLRADHLVASGQHTLGCCSPSL